jgi:putative toxin-antitoxin system antitoxin component (TIGR02293 family)
MATKSASRSSKPAAALSAVHAAATTLRAGLPVREFHVVQSRLGVTSGELADALSIAARTLARRKQAGRLRKDESERLYRLQCLFERAVEVFESDEAARSWFRAPQQALGGSTPLAFADVEPGAREVERLLGRIEQGVFS